MIARILKRLLRRSPDYSNGQWHSWCGGPCPVAKGALVQAYIYIKSDQPILETLFASELDWAHKDNPIARFRVVSPADLHRHNGEALKQSARAMAGPDDEGGA